jgi:hypothetical protein
MKQQNFVFGSILCAIFSLTFVSCQSKTSEKDQKETPIILKKEIANDSAKDKQVQTPIIQLNDTTDPRAILLMVKDSASDVSRLSMKLAHIYTQQLLPSIQKNNLTILGPPLAFYKSQRAPFFFEAGFQVNQIPRKKIKGIFTKQIGGTKAIVANFYGPYEETEQAYVVLKEWLKEKGKKASGPAYEIYVDDPLDKDGKPKDPYQILTRIVMPYR